MPMPWAFGVQLRQIYFYSIKTYLMATFWEQVAKNMYQKNALFYYTPLQ